MARAAAARRCSSPASTITKPTSSTSPARLRRPPVLIGHSMGAAIVERIVAKRPVRGAALLAPLPPAGLLPIASATRRSAPRLPDADGRASIRRRLSADVLQALRPFYFSDEVAGKDPGRGRTPPERRIAARALRSFAAAALGVAADRSAGRCSCWARRTIASAHRTMSGRRRAHHDVDADDPAGPCALLMLEPGWKHAARGARRLAARRSSSDVVRSSRVRGGADTARRSYCGRLLTNSRNSCAGSGLLTQ